MASSPLATSVRLGSRAEPPALDAIKTAVPAEALIDPQNNGSFVYKLGGETFTLYSKGKNGRDDQGRQSTTFEGDASLPKDVKDDILFWPPRGRISQMKYDDTDSNQAGIDAAGVE